jgi:phospholipase C
MEFDTANTRDWDQEFSEDENSIFDFKKPPLDALVAKFNAKPETNEPGAGLSDRLRGLVGFTGFGCYRRVAAKGNQVPAVGFEQQAREVVFAEGDPAVADWLSVGELCRSGV